MKHPKTLLTLLFIGATATLFSMPPISGSSVPGTPPPSIERHTTVQAPEVGQHFRLRSTDAKHSFGINRYARPVTDNIRKAVSEDGHAIAVVGSVLDDDNPGMYTYTFTDNSFAPLALSSDLYANGNGILADNTYICFNVEVFYSSYFVYVYKYDITTWEKTGYGYSYIQDVPIDMAWDPVSDKIYGCFPLDGEFSGYIWAQYNPESYSRMAISNMSQALTAVAADSQGQFWGIDCEGTLYKVAKETGELTEVGSTGLQLSDMAQSAAFDLKYDHLYLSGELADGNTGLWRIDTSTAEAELINYYSDNQIMMGIYVPTPEAELGAPAKVTDLSVNFENGSTSGTVSFTMPSLTYGGSELEGISNYTVKANGVEISKGSANPGEHVTANAISPAGQVKFSVYASNVAGNGPASEISVFIGPDTPCPVSNLKAELSDGNHVTISWNAPQETLNGGYFNADELSYTVRRMPENKLLAVTSATICSDIITGDEMKATYYEVTASAGGLESPAAQSNSITTGTYCTIPWSDDFSSESTFALYTVINVAGDRYTWEYYDGWRGTFVQIDYDFTNPKDDWLITPPLMMETGNTYRLKFTTRTKRALPETIEVKFGDAPTVEGLTTTVLEPETITSDDYSNTDIERTFEFYISPETDGTKYFGIHAMSEPQMARIELLNIEVSKAGQALAPEAPADLQVVAGNNGALEALVSFTAPDHSISGETLETLLKAEIYVNGELSETIDNPVPGNTVSATVATQQGNNEIRVKAYNESGQGLESVAEVYTGVVVPASVVNLKATYNDGAVLLTWDAPGVGEDGGYVNPDELTYMIMRSDRTLLAYDHTSTSFTDDLSTFSINGQGIVSYVVYPRNVAGTGYGVYSNGIVLGDAFFALPFKESFPNGFATKSPWGITSTTETSWWMTTRSNTVPNYDNDNGMAMFVPKGADESSLIYTGRFKFAGTVNPVFSLMYYNDGVNTTKLAVQYTTDYSNFTTLSEVDLSDATLSEGWNELKIPLTDLIDVEPFVAFGIRGTSASSDWSHCLYIDCIQVYDDLDYNLEFSEFDAPGSIPFGESATFAGIVTNVGNKTATGWTVDLYCNGEVLASADGESLQPGNLTTFEIIATPKYEHAPKATFKAVINFAADQNTANNSSDEREIIITVNDYPTVTDLSGEVNAEGKVVLTWTEPVAGMAPELTVESFEDYIPFIIDNIGDWTLIDIDGADGTYGISYGGQPVEFMNSTYPHAYQVFNPERCGMGSQIGIDALLPHTGEQYLASFQDVDGENNDWLISPELSGDTQTITFYVKTPIPNEGFETYEVYYSMSDNIDIESFIKVEGLKEEAFMRWEQVAFNVPDGARRFAIRHTSKDKFMLAIDDISFIKKGAELKTLELTGYNIYRDNEKIATVGADTNTYTDEISDEMTHTYALTVLYTNGESVYSNSVEVALSGLESLYMNRPYARGIQGGVQLINAVDSNVTVIAVDGRTVATLIPQSESETYPLTAGIYIVQIGDCAFKVAVR